MPRLTQRDVFDTTFTWAFCLEPGSPPFSLFGGPMPPREPLNPLWYEERPGSGHLMNETTMVLADLSISRADVAVDLSIGNRPTQRYAGPWMQGGRIKSPAAPIVPVRMRLFAQLVPLHNMVSGECLIHLRAYFTRDCP